MFSKVILLSRAINLSMKFCFCFFVVFFLFVFFLHEVRQTGFLKSLSDLMVYVASL